MKEIQIRCEGAATVELTDLNQFQGELKSLSVESYEKLKKEIVETGFAYPFNVWIDKANDNEKLYILDGHQRFRTLSRLIADGWKVPKVPVNWVHADDYQQAKRRVLQGTSQYGKIQGQGLYEFMADAKMDIAELEARFDLPDMKMIDFKLEFFDDKTGGSGGAGEEEPRSLSERFLVPPFSVLDARQGYWQDRKRQWLKMGIESERGRGENLLKMSDTLLEPDPEKRKAKAQAMTGFVDSKYEGRYDYMQGKSPKVNRLTPGGGSFSEKTAWKNYGDKNSIKEGLSFGEIENYDGANRSITGTSIFDPVLCELAYRWFSPKGSTILDPFAGGSVRGVVASKLGRQYIGCELREEQVEANREQGSKLCADPIPVWHCGDSQLIDEYCKDVQADLIFSCPPYADLEVYSEDPRDISNMPYEQFMEAYRKIIAKSCSLLKEDSFAAFVVGDIRAKDGSYRNFVSDTILAFVAAGLKLYNEAILVTAVGTLPIRAGRMFSSGRKLGKTHQQFLVFIKGSWKKAVERCGEVEISNEMFEALEQAANQSES